MSIRQSLQQSLLQPPQPSPQQSAKRPSKRPSRRSRRAPSSVAVPDRSQLEFTFGSPAAGTAARQESRRVRCRECRKPLDQPTWYAEKGLKLFFCGPVCRSAWERDAGTRRLEIRLKGRPKHRGGNWESLVERVRDRDGYRCRSCGATEASLNRRLDVHHRVPARLFASPTEANSMENLIALCPSCHKRMEATGRDAMPLFGDLAHPGGRV